MTRGRKRIRGIETDAADYEYLDRDAASIDGCQFWQIPAGVKTA